MEGNNAVPPPSGVKAIWASIVRFILSFIAAITSLFRPSRHTQELLSHMSTSKSYSEWRSYARLLDEQEGLGEWREAPEENFFLDLLETRVRMLSETRREGNPHKLIKALRSDIHRSLLGITNKKLYPYRTAAKSWITTYINLMVHLIKVVSRNDLVDPLCRYKALKDMQLAYGNSALLLNGSIALGAYHMGVVKSLYEAKLLPNVIFGCNTGALVAACLCCFEDIRPVLDGSGVDFSAFDKRGSTGSLKRKWSRLLNEGTLMDVNVLVQFAKDNLGEMTFAEAYKKTGRILNINVAFYQESGEVSWLLNYLTTPNVLIYTAAVASCATAFVYGKTPLLARAIGGKIVPFDPPTLSFTERLASFHINDAVVRLRELFNIKLTIVSECSVTRLPFLRLEHREGLAARIGHFVFEEVWRFVAFISRIPAVRGRFTGVLQNIADRAKGDVVIFPASTPTDFLKLLQNPNKSLLDYCVLRGEQQLWSHIPQLKTHIAIEMALLDEVRRIEAEDPWVLSAHDSMASRGRRLQSICNPADIEAFALKLQQQHDAVNSVDASNNSKEEPKGNAAKQNVESLTPEESTGETAEPTEDDEQKKSKKKKTKRAK